jgi:hypothetical protein
MFTAKIPVTASPSAMADITIVTFDDSIGSEYMDAAKVKFDAVQARDYIECEVEVEQNEYRFFHAVGAFRAFTYTAPSSMFFDTQEN